MNDQDVNSIPSIKLGEYPTLSAAMEAAEKAAQENDGMAALSISFEDLAGLSESFWEEEANEQMADLGIETIPDNESVNFWDRIETFISHATTEASRQDLDPENPIWENIQGMQNYLNTANAWFSKQQQEYEQGTAEVIQCPTTHFLQLFALREVRESIVQLGFTALQEGHIDYSLRLYQIQQVLSAMEKAHEDKASDNVKNLRQLSFGEIHSIISAALPEEYHCTVFTNTDDLSRRLETLGKRVARKLNIDTEEYPVERFI